MFLAVDVGNSTMKLGILNGDDWLQVWRKNTDTGKTGEELTTYFLNVFEESEIRPELISQCMIASVVPALTDKIHKVIVGATGVEPMLLDFSTKTGLKIETDKPEEIGADLIAGAVGAYAQVKDKCIVVDFGTATTLITVERPGMITGGAICAGMRITAEALAKKTALLGNIPLTPPESTLGKNTIEAMQSGLVLGHICMIEGLISRIKKELGPAKVVATGGLVDTLISHTDCFDIIDPLLTLKGMSVIARRQK